MVEAAYAEVLETPGHVLSEDILIRLGSLSFFILIHGPMTRRRLLLIEKIDSVEIS
jgi:hypothetical protein